MISEEEKEDKTVKIGVLTYHRSHNYGAYLQAYALTEWIKENTGAEIEIIDFNMTVAENFYKKEIIRGKSVKRILSNFKRYRMFRSGIVKELPVSAETLISNRHERFVEYIREKYDVIIVGSDEVWKLGFRGFPNPYWLPDIENVKKFAYAVSARCDYSVLSEKKCEKLRKYMNEFEYIGVRDKSTAESVAPYVDDKEKIHLNCDPTFNYDFKPDIESGKKMLKQVERHSEKKTIAFMFIDNTLAQQFIRYYGDSYNYVALYDHIDNIPNLCTITPFQWVNVIAASDFLITSYFHGMCFAIKSNIPFVVMEIRGGKKEDSKSYDLLSSCGLEERFYMREELLKTIAPVIRLVDRDIQEKPHFEGVVQAQQEKALSFLDEVKRLLK